MVSGATVTSVGYQQSLQSALDQAGAVSVTQPTVRRRVEHVMGLPVSLALRGRHADDAVADDAWAAVVADLREVDRVFSTYRADSVISRLRRGEIAVDGARRGRRGAGASASAPASSPAVRSTCVRATGCSTPAAW